MGQLGETLRERRTSLGLALETAEDATKIRAKLLKALEDGEYDRLPNPGYVRGYITSYARFLELDSVPLLAMYRAETGAGRFHDAALAPPDEAVRPRAQQHEVPWRVGLAIVVGIIVVSIAIWIAIGTKSGGDKVTPIPTSGASTTLSDAVSPGATGSASPAAKPTGNPAAKLTPFSLKVSVQSGGASALVVTVDGKQAYVGTLTGGSKTFEVTTKATVKVGRPSVTLLYRDGAKVAIPTTSGTPTVVLNANTAP